VLPTGTKEKAFGRCQKTWYHDIEHVNEETFGRIKEFAQSKRTEPLRRRSLCKKRLAYVSNRVKAEKGDKVLLRVAPFYLFFLRY
jgi:hypothetical protein